MKLSKYSLLLINLILFAGISAPAMANDVKSYNPVWPVIADPSPKNECLTAGGEWYPGGLIFDCMRVPLVDPSTVTTVVNPSAPRMAYCSVPNSELGITDPSASGYGESSFLMKFIKGEVASSSNSPIIFSTYGAGGDGEESLFVNDGRFLAPSKAGVCTVRTKNNSVPVKTFDPPLLAGQAPHICDGNEAPIYYLDPHFILTSALSAGLADNHPNLGDSDGGPAAGKSPNWICKVPAPIITPIGGYGQYP